MSFLSFLENVCKVIFRSQRKFIATSDWLQQWLSSKVHNVKRIEHTNWSNCDFLWKVRNIWNLQFAINKTNCLENKVLLCFLPLKPPAKPTSSDERKWLVQVLTGQRDSQTLYTLKRIHQSNLLVNREMLWFTYELLPSPATTFCSYSLVKYVNKWLLGAPIRTIRASKWEAVWNRKWRNESVSGKECYDVIPYLTRNSWLFFQWCRFSISTYCRNNTERHILHNTKNTEFCK